MSGTQNNPNRLYINTNCYIVQDSVKKNTNGTIVLQTTINCTYNVIVPRKNSQKNPDTNIEDPIRYRAEYMGKLFQLANFYKKLRAKTVGENYSFNVNILAMEI